MRHPSRILLVSAFVAAALVPPAAIAQQPPQPVDADLRAGSVLRAGPSTRDAVTQRVPRTVPAWVYGCTEQRGWCEVELESGARAE